MRLPKIDFSEELYVMLTASPSTIDEDVMEPEIPMGKRKTTLVIIKKGEDNFEMKLSLDYSVAYLRYQIFKMTYIHPNNQILKAGTTYLSNSSQTLRYYAVENNSIIELSFKTISNIKPLSFNDQF